MAKMSKNKKKKLRKRKKKQRELLEKQLNEMEILNAESDVPSKIPNSILNEKVTIPRINPKSMTNNGVEKDHEKESENVNDEQNNVKKKKKVCFY